MTAYLLRMRSGCEGGGKGALVQTEKSGTLATNNDQVLFVIEDKVYETHAQDARYKEKDKCPTLTSRYGTGGGNVPLVLMDQGGQQMSVMEDKVGTLRAQEHGHQPVVFPTSNISQVRRLTPRECERLQNFPDDWTLIPYNGKPADKCPDAPRYKALGNSWNVNCVRWIGQRIDDFLEGRLQ